MFDGGGMRCAFPPYTLLSHGALRFASSRISGTTRGGAESASTNAAKPAGLMRISAGSMMPSSAARTAASLMKSVRDWPRRPAAQSMTEIDERWYRVLQYDPVSAARLLPGGGAP
jgi:hypothetical protein